MVVPPDPWICTCHTYICRNRAGSLLPTASQEQPLTQDALPGHGLLPEGPGPRVGVTAWDTQAQTLSWPLASFRGPSCCPAWACDHTASSSGPGAQPTWSYWAEGQRRGGSRAAALADTAVPISQPLAGPVLSPQGQPKDIPGSSALLPEPSLRLVCTGLPQLPAKFWPCQLGRPEEAETLLPAVGGYMSSILLPAWPPACAAWLCAGQPPRDLISACHAMKLETHLQR